MRQAPEVLLHFLALQSVLATRAGTSAAVEAASVASEIPPTSSPPWDMGFWGVNLDELR
jgi:hypothetical protein